MIPRYFYQLLLVLYQCYCRALPDARWRQAALYHAGQTCPWNCLCPVVFLSLQAFSHRCPRWFLALVLVVFGLGIEFLQSLTSYRHGDGWDMLANTAGILIVWLLVSSQSMQRD